MSSQHEMVSRAELAGEVGSERYYGGLIYRKSAGMHVGRFVRGLAEAAARRGVEIHEHAPMTGLRPAAGGGHEIETPKGRLRASQVLLASGTSHTGPLGWIRRRIVPVGAFLIVTEPLPIATLDRLLPHRRMAGRYEEPGQLLPKPRPTTGCSSADAPASLSPTRPQTRRAARSCRLRCTTSFRASHRAHRLLLGRHGRHDARPAATRRRTQRHLLFHGYSGHGTQIVDPDGTIMAEVMDGRTELNPWKDFAWPAIPGHLGPPGVLPLVGAYYRIKDRFNDLGRSTPDGSRLPRQILHRQRMAEATGSATAVVVIRRPSSQSPKSRSATMRT